MVTFGEVIEAVKAGNIAYRENWNGIPADREMFVFQYKMPVEPPLWEEVPTPRGMRQLLPFLCLVTDDAVAYGWLASQADMLADDWNIVYDAPEDEQGTTTINFGLEKLEDEHPATDEEFTAVKEVSGRFDASRGTKL